MAVMAVSDSPRANCNKTFLAGGLGRFIARLGRNHSDPRSVQPNSRAADRTHECVFVEEQEPSGRLILPPCIVCGFTAMDALEQMRQETGR